jgi:hypothetical protein
MQPLLTQDEAAVKAVRQDSGAASRDRQWPEVSEDQKQRALSAGRLQAMITELTNPTLQKQQSYNLPPLEQWYVGLLHSGRLPHAKEATPYVALTRALVENAKQRVPRLRDLSDVALRNFLTDQEAMGVLIEKYRNSAANG